MLQALVDTVNPGGTGSPAFVISARPAPLPPSVSFMSLLPSALPPPKKYTYWVTLASELGDVGDASTQGSGLGQERHAVVAQLLVLVHHEHFVEESVHRGPQPPQRHQALLVAAVHRLEQGHRLEEGLLGGQPEQVLPHRRQARALLEDVVHPLEGDREL